MLTLGVDLSTEAKRTAACLVRWLPGEAPTIVEVVHPASDEEIVSLAANAAATGIDAPFGWPRLWADAVSRHVPGSQFEADGTPAVLTRRATDHWIGQNVKVYPLAVAANLIGATAIRCARLINQLPGSIDQGTAATPPLISEVYPAAALARWGLSHTLYKGSKFVEARLALLLSLEAAGWPLNLSEAMRGRLVKSDDVLDAVVCSFVARAVLLGLTDDAPPHLRDLARAEGWIRVPKTGTRLAQLNDVAPVTSSKDVIADG